MKKDLRSENVKKIAEDFPMCITEIKDKDGNLKKVVDFEKLKDLFSDDIREKEEAYEFTWAGKREALHKAFEYNDKILRPVVNDSLNFFDTQNIYIEGDNLDVLKILRRSYFEKVKMIYIDPPYNTGHDFIYKDKFEKSKEEYDEEQEVYDEEGNMLRENKESDGRFHSNWCSMIYSRLLLARDLLRPDGVIFISIDDNEVASLRKICDEVFGEDNFVGSPIWRSSDNSKNDAKQFSGDHNYTLIYSKSPLWQPEKIQDENKRKHFKNPDNDPKGPWFDGNPLNSPNYRKNLCYTITAPNGNIIQPPKNGWRWSSETMQEKINTGEIFFNENQTNIKRKTYLCDMEGLPPSSLWVDLDITGHNRQAKYELLNLMPEDVFDTPKPTKLLKYIIKLVRENKDSIIMDFFSGSGSTAEAVMQLNAEDNGNRKYIMVQIPENLDYNFIHAGKDKKTVLKNAINLCDKMKVPHVLSEIAKERIRRAGKKIKEETNANIDYGFKVFKVDSSNFKEEISVPADEFDFKNLENCIENIKEDRTSLDLVYQCILNSRKELTLPIKIENIEGFTVYNVDNFSIMCCFDENISDEVMKYMADKEPEAVYFRDSCFRDSSHKLNVKEYFKVMSETTRFEDV